MSPVDTPRAAALRSSTSTFSSDVSSKPVVRMLVSCGTSRAAAIRSSRAFISASWPRPFRSFSTKLMPALEPRPRTGGGSVTKMRASRMLASSRLAWRAMASADW